MSLNEDFEFGLKSQFFGAISIDQEGRKDLVTATDNVAANGRCSLKVQDRSDLKAGYNPLDDIQLDNK